MHYPFLAEGTLALVAFFGKNVTFESFLKGNFSCSGYLEALLSAGVCFNFRHKNNPVKNYTLLVVRTGEHLLNLTGNVLFFMNLNKNSPLKGLQK
jgi:hypothetical protein